MKAKNTISLLGAGFVTSLIGVNAVSALTYQSNVGVNFTFNPSISVSVSDNLVINNLTPGDSSDSNIITVGVSTNSVAGYTLSATVGNKTDASTALTNTSNGSYTFTNLAATPGIAANLAAFSDNTWGYSYCKDTSSNCSSSGSATWISGSVGADGAAGSSVAGYAGLPLDNNDNADERGKNGVTLINKTTPTGNNSVEFKIGAKASATQPAGTYTNVVNFYAVSYAAPVSLYDAYLAANKPMLNGYFTMQGMDSTVCANTTQLETPLDVIDIRDGEIYKISKLADERCWLIDNLRLDLTDATVINTLSSANTNASDVILGYLKNGGGTTSDQYPTAGLSGTEWSSSYSYSVPQAVARFKDNTTTSYGLGSGKVGVYYNYCAASAGSYCWGNGTSSTGSPSTDPNPDSYRDIDADICPTNWHLPDYNGEYTAQLSAYPNQTATDSSSYQYNFSTPLSGYISSGSSQYGLGTGGYFWSSTWGNSHSMNNRYVNATGVGNGNNGRNDGRSVRCIANN